MTTLEAVTVEETRSNEPFDQDVVLVEKSLSGDETAFELLFQRYFSKVLAIAHSVLLDRDEAEDAAQEIFTLVFRNLSKFDRRSRFSTWLFRLAVNRSIQESRKGKKRKLAINLDRIEGIPSPEPSPSEVTCQVEEALAQIPPTDRAILAMFYWEEFSISEIASSLGCRENAAKTRLYRARERFRSIYKEDPDEENPTGR